MVISANHLTLGVERYLSGSNLARRFSLICSNQIDLLLYHVVTGTDILGKFVMVIPLMVNIKFRVERYLYPVRVLNGSFR